jgi:lipoyl(octanoyl) transferase
VSVLVHRLGRVGYENALEIQNLFLSWRKAGGPDSLVLLEHPALLTLGRGARLENIVHSEAELKAQNISVHETDRGGDVTYHGPGQLVGYPLMHLAPGEQDVRKYVRRLEEVIIRTVKDFNIESTRIEKWPGVWLENPARKIAAIGVHLSRWYTKHGFALNVNTNLSHFNTIVPCGITEGTVTSMQQELGREVKMSEVEYRIVFHFEQVFEADVHLAPPLDSYVSLKMESGEVKRAPRMFGEDPRVTLARMTPVKINQPPMRTLIPKSNQFPVRLDEVFEFNSVPTLLP